ncbi:MAG: MarR family transcriptional regulator [Marinosulfonomonas sp.]|nr:MarR family transcriptional regulator [Marinosulfonomonas sp.]
MAIGLEFTNDLARVARRWRTRLDKRFRELGLTQARWMALWVLSRSGPMTQRDLAEQLGIEGPTLVRQLDGLEKQGLIERRSDDQDRRLKWIHLTDSAAPLLTEMADETEEIRRDVLADIRPEDLQVAQQVLSAIALKLET